MHKIINNVNKKRTHVLFPLFNIVYYLLILVNSSTI